MTFNELLKRVDNLAPLPKTLLDIEKVKKKENFENSDLVAILEQDPLMVSTILKTANSAMFGFSSKIDTLSRAVSLLGTNFTISIALGSGIKNTLNEDLHGYNKSSDEFLCVANMQSNFLNLWMGKVNVDLKNDLILPAFLQESGKFIINAILIDENKIDKFSKAIESRFDDIASVEKEFVGINAAEVTAAIFKHWNLTPKIINSIKYSDQIEKAPPKFEQHAKILYIVKLYTTPRK